MKWVQSIYEKWYSSSQQLESCLELVFFVTKLKDRYCFTGLLISVEMAWTWNLG